MQKLWELFIVFARIGGFMFGGGYAMLPLLQKEVVEEKRWASEEEIMDYYAIGQCTPGIIAVNTATFVGYKQKGVTGAIAATLGVITPAVCMILAIAAFLGSISQYAVIEHAFAGIQVCVCVLVFNAVRKLIRKSVVDAQTTFIFVLVLTVGLLSAIPTVLLVVASGLLGVLLSKTRGSVR